MDDNSDRAFEALYEDTYQRLSAYCQRRTHTLSDAEEAVAIVYSIAWRRRLEFVAADSPLAWLYAVAWKTLRNQDRSNRSHDGLKGRLAAFPEPYQASIETLVGERMDLERALRALERLRPRDRELIQLAALEGLTYQEIALVFDKSEASIRTDLSRARQKLRRIYQKLRDGGVADG